MGRSGHAPWTISAAFPSQQLRPQPLAPPPLHSQAHVSFGEAPTRSPDDQWCTSNQQAAVSDHVTLNELLDREEVGAVVDCLYLLLGETLFHFIKRTVGYIAIKVGRSP
jgi:hypothetical protein